MIEQLPEIKLVGIAARTSNALEGDQGTAKIPNVMQQFFMNELQTKIVNRKNPGRVYAVYTSYASDEHGDYTYFLGEEVTTFAPLILTMETLIIPAQTYTKLISSPGKMPDVVIDMWRNIWKMTASDLGGQRGYVADFEIYGENSQDPTNTIAEIYIGIK